MRPPLSEPPAPRPKIFIVGGGPFQLDLVRTARALGAEVAVADRNPDAPGLALADTPIAVDIVDLDAMVEAARTFGADGVLTAASDVALPAVAAIAEALGLRAIAPGAVERCRDKLSMYETVRDASLPVPETRLVGDDTGVDALATELGGYPIVVKPRSAAGGRGVSVVRDPGSLHEALARARRHDRERRRDCLAQAFVGGHPIGVEAFFGDGQLLGAYVMDDQFAPGFVSPIGHSLPSRLPAETQLRIAEDVVRFAEVLGVTEGPANFDLRWSGGETILLEVNARLGGNSITDLVRTTYGVDLSGATLRACIGQDPTIELQAGEAQPTATRLLVVRGEGRARVPSEPFADVDREGLLSIELTVRDGDPLALRVDEHAIVGRCIVQAPTAAEAARRAAQIAERVEARIGVIA